MKNPWEEIKKGKYVLSADQDRINKFNKTAAVEHQLQVELIPDPFFGNRKAKVVLLMLNPGFGSNELDNYKQNNFEEILLNNLKHSNSKNHFFSLDKTFHGTDAFKYWKPRVKELNEKGFDNDLLSERLFCINLFPYHSRKYRKISGELLKSQKYSLHLLDKAINEPNTIIISMRSFRLWEEAYLKIYDKANSFEKLIRDGKMMRVKNYRNPTLSTANLGEKNFEKLIKKLKESL